MACVFVGQRIKTMLRKRKYFVTYSENISIGSINYFRIYICKKLPLLSQMMFHDVEMTGYKYITSFTLIHSK